MHVARLLDETPELCRDGDTDAKRCGEKAEQQPGGSPRRRPKASRSQRIQPVATTAAEPATRVAPAAGKQQASAGAHRPAAGKQQKRAQRERQRDTGQASGADGSWPLPVQFARRSESEHPPQHGESRPTGSKHRVPPTVEAQDVECDQQRGRTMRCAVSCGLSKAARASGSTCPDPVSECRSDQIRGPAFGMGGFSRTQASHVQTRAASASSTVTTAIETRAASRSACGALNCLRRRRKRFRTCCAASKPADPTYLRPGGPSSTA